MLGRSYVPSMVLLSVSFECHVPQMFSSFFQLSVGGHICYIFFTCSDEQPILHSDGTMVVIKS